VDLFLRRFLGTELTFITKFYDLYLYYFGHKLLHSERSSLGHRRDLAIPQLNRCDVRKLGCDIVGSIEQEDPYIRKLCSERDRGIL